MEKVKLLLTVCMLTFTVFGLTVYDVQYSTTGSSPHEGEVVTVTAMVSATGYDGDKYYLTDPGGGPWSGVYVYDYSNSPSVGDWVTIRAEVDEYYDLTELKNVESFSTDSTGTVPEAYSTTCSDAGSLEELEGVLIRLSEVVVTDISGDEWTVEDGTGSLGIKRGFDYSFAPTLGDTIESVTGVITYSYGSYYLEPRSNDDIAAVSDTSDTTGPGDITPIADIMENPGAYSTVTIEGVITVPAGALHSSQVKAYIQDDSGKGIQVFSYTPTGSEFTDFTRGAVINMTGDITEYSGNIEITDYTYEVVGTGDMPDPFDIISYSGDFLDYQGTWCEITGDVTSVGDYSSFNIAVDCDGTTIDVRVWESTGIPSSTVSTGDNVTIEGVAAVYNSSFQLLPALLEDITVNDSTGSPDTTEPGDLITIEEVQTERGDGETVTIKGIVTIPAGAISSSMLQAYIQDESGYGVQIFDYGVEDYMEDFARGNEIQLTGTITEYNGVTEITDFTYTVESTGNELPTAMNIMDYYANSTDYEGGWHTVSGIISGISGTGSWNMYIQTDMGYDITARIWESTGILADDYTVGNAVTVYGVGGIYSDDYQILPGTPDDIESFIPDPAPEEPEITIPDGVFAPGVDGTMELSFGVPTGYTATLRIFDRRGRTIATLYHGNPANTITLPWDGRDETGKLLQPGAYLVHLSTSSPQGDLDPVTETLVIGSVLK